MRKALPLAAALAFALAATACASLVEGLGVPAAESTAADGVIEYVAELCALPAAERAPLLAELNDVAAPARVTVACAR